MQHSCIYITRPCVTSFHSTFLYQYIMTSLKRGGRGGGGGGGGAGGIVWLYELLEEIRDKSD